MCGYFHCGEEGHCVPICKNKKDGKPKTDAGKEAECQFKVFKEGKANSAVNKEALKLYSKKLLLDSCCYPTQLLNGVPEDEKADFRSSITGFGAVGANGEWMTSLGDVLIKVSPNFPPHRAMLSKDIAEPLLSVSQTCDSMENGKVIFT